MVLKYLEQGFWVPDDVEKPSPARHLGLASTSHDYVQSGIEMVEKLDDGG